MVAPKPNYREAGELLSAYGQRLGMEGDDAGAQQALASAMAIAKHEGDLTLEMVMLINAAWVDVHHLRLQESGEKSLRALELMERLDDPQRGWEALLNISRVHYNAGELEKAEQYAIRLQSVVERLGNPTERATSLYDTTFHPSDTSLYLNEKLAMLGGDWTSARQFCDRGLMVDPQHENILLVRVLLEYTTGDFKQGDVFLERLIGLYHSVGSEPGWVHGVVALTIAVVGHLTGIPKHFDVAQAAAETVLRSQRVSPNLVSCAHTGLALIAAQLGDMTTVREYYNVLRGQRGIHNVIDVNRLRGILAAASEEWDEATAYFEAVLETWGKGNYPEYAWGAYEYANMLLQRGSPADQAKATSLLDIALDISHELGMTPLAERVLLRKESVTT